MLMAVWLDAQPCTSACATIPVIDSFFNNVSVLVKAKQLSASALEPVSKPVSK